jgi:hypothetical protein
MKMLSWGILGGALLWSAVSPAGSSDKEPRPAKPAASPQDTKKAPRPVMSVRLLVTVEGMTEVPSPSSVELKAEEPSCDHLDRPLPLSTGGTASATQIPVCTVTAVVLVSGLNAMHLKIDVAKYKEGQAPIHVHVKSDKAEVVEDK